MPSVVNYNLVHDTQPCSCSPGSAGARMFPKGQSVSEC